ncbi:hypothetical protein ACPPVU_02455 [Mucilaginibacter sp. McL0603]|uniref:hypothetical protein n=1 Tax=Mucilaginibacter sp. McL0603 TaxID=3415670 RepID=UPI003CF7ECAB
MRLSNKQKFLIHFSLIISLTLLLKTNANAQAAQSDNVFAYNDYLHNRSLSNESEADHIYIRADVNNHDEEPADEQILPTINFHRASENFYSKPFAYRLAKNNRKAYPAHGIMPTMVYSIDLKHSARLTFKLFKLVIVPLWQSK